ncbi:MAG: NAD(+) synthase [Candidatus Hodarchaeales archaeon]
MILEDLDISAKADKIVAKIGNFIETSKEEQGVDGVVILFSGYIDSTVITKIALDSLGESVVKLIIRSENIFDKHTDTLKNSIEYLGIAEENVVHCDVAPLMKKFLSDDLIPGHNREIPSLYQPLSYSLLKSSLIKELEGNTYGMVGKANSGRERLIHKIIAHNKLRSRIQMAVAYLTAETENAFLLGTINKTEIQTGLFTKWGHGHCADIMPLGNLYRTQILQIADYLDIPSKIANLAKADLLPGIENKYQYFFKLSANEVDRILVRLENGLSENEIHTQTLIDLKSIEKVIKYVSSAVYTRGAPLIPKI